MTMNSPDMPPPRRLACTRCGAAFDCSLDGGCWCAEEPYRLPLPESGGGDCLCPDCLRRLAAAQKPPVT
jgi:Cysteine-rich CWC